MSSLPEYQYASDVLREYVLREAVYALRTPSALCGSRLRFAETAPIDGPMPYRSFSTVLHGENEQTSYSAAACCTRRYSARSPFFRCSPSASERPISSSGRSGAVRTVAGAFS